MREEEQLSILVGESVAEEDDANTGDVADAAAAGDSVIGGIAAVPPGVPPDGPPAAALPPAAPRPGRERSRSRDAIPEGDATTLVQGVARLAGPLGEETMGVDVAGISTQPSTSLSTMPGGAANGTSSSSCSSTSMVVGDCREDAPEV